MIRAVDLPMIKHDLLAWYRDGRAEAFFDNVYPSETPTAMRIKFADLLASVSVDLYYVAPQMAQLAVEAAKTIPDYSLQQEDLPSMVGLLYTPEPLWNRDYEVEVAPNVFEPITERVHGFAWAVLEGQGVQTIWLTERRDYTDQISAYPKLVEATRRMLPLVHETHVPGWWSFGQEPGKPADVDSAQKHGAVTKTFWTLMQQSILNIEDATYSRADRKRIARIDPEAAPVRIITLRRSQTSSDESEASGREYHHQWIVRGHWRQQWHPKREVHRPVWIAPHVKGPEGAPMLGGEKVHLWKR